MNPDFAGMVENDKKTWKSSKKFFHPPYEMTDHVRVTYYAHEGVVSNGNSRAFYVVSVPLEYILSIPLHSSYVIVYFVLLKSSPETYFFMLTEYIPT